MTGIHFAPSPLVPRCSHFYVATSLSEPSQHPTITSPSIRSLIQVGFQLAQIRSSVSRIPTHWRLTSLAPLQLVLQPRPAFGVVQLYSHLSQPTLFDSTTSAFGPVQTGQPSPTCWAFVHLLEIRLISPSQAPEFEDRIRTISTHDFKIRNDQQITLVIVIDIDLRCSMCVIPSQLCQ